MYMSYIHTCICQQTIGVQYAYLSYHPIPIQKSQYETSVIRLKLMSMAPRESRPSTAPLIPLKTRPLSPNTTTTNPYPSQSKGQGSNPDE